MAYRALEVEGRVLSCQAKSSDGFTYHVHFFVCACKFLELGTFMNL